ncbi:glycoside hydrolase family 113 [Sulfobacillus thermosulfidooxidans]|uniref:glycoside hydrolase family 113 n=1 Tax=Sulfobacillus thermosulfidooxidans TaxID=28034 RepID=UPI00096B82B4|nr:hypothetical protein [Sulfobacillus thermosulfidooxidans]OLZ11203.1 hypothetical protein BFX05_07945 [Sulfobacillus thermosulfidooxidans]OLZ13458.1 hypothetical protein BFX06_09820 [Sulfobacillus thermosulfidooxidans]OLZ21705.1 hypothetical protein BFX07_12870 [Sulfobacillus thermosulfidooxidans]
MRHERFVEETPLDRTVYRSSSWLCDVPIYAMILYTVFILIWVPRLKPATAAYTIQYASMTRIPFGFVFPGWIVHSPQLRLMSTKQWQQQCRKMMGRTHSLWVELPIALYQNNVFLPVITRGPLTPNPSQVADEIVFAHRIGLKVFVVPTVIVGNAVYSGDIHYNSVQAEQAWFDSYARQWGVYARIAALTQANALGVSTELDGLQSAPSSLWEHLIAQLHGQYPGPLWVDLNWASVGQFEPWLKDSLIADIGVSAYFPLEQTPHPLPYAAILSRWNTRVLPRLNQLSAWSGHPVGLSELGFKNASNALYEPYTHLTTTLPDPRLQDHALMAAIKDSQTLPLLGGIFVYAWDMGYFSPAPTSQHVWVQTGFVHKRVYVHLQHGHVFNY